MKTDPKFVTKAYLDKKLEQTFKEYAKIIISAVDGVVEKRLTKVKLELKKDISGVESLIDGLCKGAGRI